MIGTCELLYRDMISDIRECRGAGLTFLEESECRFRVAEKYWQQARLLLMEYSFKDIGEEIFFFKMVKPKFIAESELARLLCYAISFCPDPLYSQAQCDFWKRQILRIEKFKEKYKPFYQYYISGRTDLDVAYYTRAAPGDTNYAFDKTSSNFDELTGLFLAREQYTVYAREQLAVTRHRD